ncbi:MAG: GH33 / GH93, partial [uncultured Phycisphaerae bacterium]
ARTTPPPGPCRPGGAAPDRRRGGRRRGREGQRVPCAPRRPVRLRRGAVRVVPRVHHRPGGGRHPALRVLRRQGRGRPERRHLARPARRRSLVRAGRGGDGRGRRRQAPPVLEPGALPAHGPRRRAADALLQGRPEPRHLVGHAHDLRRRRQDVVEARPAAGRHPGAGEEQAAPTGGRHDPVRLQHGARRVARPLRTYRGPRQDLDADRAAERQERLADPADDPPPRRRRRAAGAVPQPAGQGVRVPLARRRQDLGPAVSHGTAELEHRRRRRHARRRAARADLQPHAEGPHAAQRRPLRRRGQDLARRAGAGVRARRVLVPRRNPGRRRARPRDLHLEPQADQARRAHAGGPEV